MLIEHGEISSCREAVHWAVKQNRLITSVSMGCLAVGPAPFAAALCVAIDAGAAVQPLGEGPDLLTDVLACILGRGHMDCVP